MGKKDIDHQEKKTLSLQPRHTESSHAEDINQVLFTIADAVNTTPNLDDLYKTIHQSLGNIIDVSNFFIAIVDSQKKTLYFPYFIDSVDDDFSPITDFDTGSSLTGLVVVEKKPILLKSAELQEREAKMGIWGPSPLIWMGVPLIIRDNVIGVIAVQSYTDPNIYNHNDLQILSAVSHQTAIAIDRKLSLEDLAKSERRFRQLFEHSNDAIFLLSLGGIILDCNNRATDLLGYPHEELLTLSAQQLLFPEDHGAFNEALQNTSLLGHIRFETTFRRSDNSAIEVEVSARIIDDPDQQIVQGIVRDITEQKNAEKKLKRSEQTYRNIFLNAQVGLFRIKFSDGMLIECNDAITRMLGYSSRQDCIRKFSIPGTYADPRAFQKAFKIVKKHGKIRDNEAQFYRKDGSLSWLRYSAKNYREENYLEGVVEDITEFKAAQEEKLMLQKKLNRSKKMEVLGLLAGGVAHDLNNILSGIISYPELMLLKLDEKHELVSPIKAIRDAGKRAAMVVTDLLTIARSATSVREVHSINTLVLEYIHSPECSQLATLYPDLAIELQLDAFLPNISCSPVNVKKCLMNLVTNGAEAANGEGTITISTDNKHIQKTLHDAPGSDNLANFVVLTVEDMGPGIDKKDIEHIFEPFYTRKVMGKSGTGLGLTVVWNTMEDHKGEVQVESSADTTRFKLVFPTSQQESTTTTESFCIDHFKGNGEHILIVDDEPQLRDIASKILSSLGYSTHKAASGEAAIEYLKKDSADLVLLDMLMEPGLNGRQTYEKIITSHPGQKAVIASGYSESDEVKLALRLGVGAFVKKPYSLEELSTVIKQELVKQ